ncbi:MAG: VWA domain-containing protein [Candidatus Doudnabacteria bacterium]|nr:VWA domain-containing protein [Candidatus Doudnabacteria bacterium]
MSKNKKKKWWEKGWGGYKVELNDDGSKTYKPDYDSDEFWDSNYSSGDYWGQKLNHNQGRNDTSYADAQKEFGSAYKDYNKSGYWSGYSSYRAPQLSYKYVQQMANALAAQHHITVEIGNDWQVDLENKKLIYNPASLIYGTKGELLATLMHEMGKLRYMTHYKQLTNKYLSMYELPALEVLTVFEDVRVDYLMLKAYEGASEIYESAIPAVERQIKKYYDYGEAFRKNWPKIIWNEYKRVIQDTAGDDEARKIRLLQYFGEADMALVEMRLASIEAYYRDNGSLFEYCGDILNVMYDLEQKTSGFENIEKKVKLTEDAIEPAKRAASSQDLVNLMDTAVYPHVEDLLKDLNDKNEQLKKMFPNMAKEMVEHLIKQLDQMLKGLGGANDPMPSGKQGKTSIRGSGPSDREIPPEWLSGDYEALKSSVSGEVRSLINKLMFIRREEQTTKYTQDQKRGKLNSKKLHKMVFNSRRLFKQKLPAVDTIQSFAFSVLLDVSGSMAGERMVHSTRAVIIFNEVFKKMQIPFELIAFDDGAKTIKKFDQDSSKAIEKRIGGLAAYNGGGTNLDRGLNAVTLRDREEKNKIMVVISDGGVGDVNQYNNGYFRPFREKYGIKSVGIGIACEPQMAQLCEGNSRMLSNPGEVPVEFINLIKTLFKKRG